MNIPQVSTACCGQSLRTASLIIAWFLSVLVGIVWSLYLSILPTLHNEFNHGFDRMSHALSSVVGMILTYFFIEHCLLLYGLLKKQHYFLLPWIVMTCITIGVGIGVSALLLILTFCVSAVALLFFVPNSLLTNVEKEGAMYLVFSMVALFIAYWLSPHIIKKSELKTQIMKTLMYRRFS